ncbi:hypothetical protein UB45_06005 [Terrabacter sp. 28]|nr:hypothetical protein UB45_06005 [Terrabacter sp. 28]
MLGAVARCHILLGVTPVHVPALDRAQLILFRGRVTQLGGGTLVTGAAIVVDAVLDVAALLPVHVIASLVHRQGLVEIGRRGRRGRTVLRGRRGWDDDGILDDRTRIDRGVVGAGCGDDLFFFFRLRLWFCGCGGLHRDDLGLGVRVRGSVRFT